MVPLAVPARSLGWGSTRDTLYLESLEFPCDASSCDDTRVPVFMREDRNQTRESRLTCIPALLSSSDPEVFFTHSLPPSAQRLSPNPAVIAIGGLVVAIPISDRKRCRRNRVFASVFIVGVHSRGNPSDHDLKGSKNPLHKR
jgi:hypothetical protein